MAEPLRVRRDAAPVVVRLAHGDLRDARASVAVVSHFNGLGPSGAEAAIDAALDGALTRRDLDAPLGATTFIPAPTGGLAARGVLVLGLGQVEKLRPERLHELGYALVDALASFGIPDAATVVPGAGALDHPRADVARRLLEGVYDALGRAHGAERFRDLTVVELDDDHLADIRDGLQAARAPSRVHVYLAADPLPAGRRPAAAPPATIAGTTPPHLRVGITRAGPRLKVTVAQDDATIRSHEMDWPEEVDANAVRRLDAEVLRERRPGRRTAALQAIGEQLFRAFLDPAPLGIAERLRETRGAPLVLGCDQLSVRLPWELLHDGEQFLSRSHQLARQLEIGGAGRGGAWPPDDGLLKVLVVGDPSRNLRGARREAARIAERLEGLDGVRVTHLGPGVTWDELSRELNADHDVLHFAGHARFDDVRKGSSGLILSDGTLTADDASTRTHLPRVVVANACNAAKSDGDLFEGGPPTRDLVAGLLSAGVRAMVGSMWKVDDEAAATFGEAFYAALAPADGGPATIGEAVRAARTAAADAHPDDPAWGGYALYGSPWRRALAAEEATAA